MLILLTPSSGELLTALLNISNNASTISNDSNDKGALALAREQLPPPTTIVSLKKTRKDGPSRPPLPEATNGPIELTRLAVVAKYLVSASTAYI